MTRDLPKDIDVWFIDPYSGMLIGKGTSGSSEYYTRPDNIKLKTPPEAKKDRVIIWDNQKDDWLHVPLKVAVINDEGFIISIYNTPIPYNEIKNLDGTVIYEDLPNNMVNPRWNGKKWEDKPVPEGMLLPKYNRRNGTWEENASGEEIERLCDVKIYNAIKEWCFTQGKCEEYFINRGIEDKNDPAYLEYGKEKQKIIKSIKEKNGLLKSGQKTESETKVKAKKRTASKKKNSGAT